MAPRRLNLLADLAARLAEAPESPETLQAIVECTLTGTMSDAAVLRVEVSSGDTLVFRAGGERPRSARKLSLRLRADTAAVGALTVYGERTFHDADRLFLETVSTHLGAALAGARLRIAQRAVTAPADAGAADGGSGFGRLRSLFGGAVGRVAPPAGRGAALTDARRLDALSGDLVTLARLEASTVVGSAELPVAPWLRRLVARRLDRAAAAGRALLLVEPDRPLTVNAVAEHLAVAVDHLIANALAYSPAGSAIGVSAERRDDEVHLHVDDEGPGVAPRERERIFERFFRGRAAVAADVPGSGLGLRIVAEVAAAHGGRAWCEPSPMGGSRFTIALPAV